ncbi:MAG: hypothetical protein IJ091_03925 [Oscillospiraceae bacterium]|nr:hypothetical protein [Oscillospiraceae bacterium]
MENTEIKTIGKDYTLGGLAKFVSAPVITQFALSMLQTLDDSLFLSRYVGTDALAAFSLCHPLFMILDAVACMLCGVSVLCATQMGEGRTDQAKKSFTSIALVLFIFGCSFALVRILFLEPILRALGVTDNLIPYAIEFLSISNWYLPIITVNYLFSRFYVTAGKPKYSMVTTLLNAFCNFFFDWLFIAKMGMGIRGSAFANLIGTAACVSFGLWFYSSKQAEVGFSSLVDDWGTLLRRVFQFGFPELMTSLSLALSSYVANRVLLKIGGELVISARTIVNSIQFMFMSGFFGLIDSSVPLVSFAYGEKNKEKMVRVMKQILILSTSLFLFIFLVYSVFGKGIVSLYMSSNSDPSLADAIYAGLKLAPLGFLFFGYNIAIRAMFSAVNNSKVAAILSVPETLIFPNAAMLTLPFLMGVDGVWWCYPVNQILTFAITLYFAYRCRNQYGYGRSGIATALEN